MGFYLSLPITIGKAGYLIYTYGALEIPRPNTLFDLYGTGQAVICVVENAMFDAALYVHDDRELDRTSCNPQDVRRRTWLLMNEELTKKLAGYKVTE